MPDNMWEPMGGKGFGFTESSQLYVYTIHAYTHMQELTRLCKKHTHTQHGRKHCQVCLLIPLFFSLLLTHKHKQ